MQIFGLILLFIAYTLGVVTIFLEVICYRKKVEYIETIFFSIAFLLVIFAISISSLIGYFSSTESVGQSIFTNLSLVGLGLTALLNVFAERQLNIADWVKFSLYSISALLVIFVIGHSIYDLQFSMHLIVYGFLAASIIISMLLIRNTEPDIHIKHQEKIERKMAVAVLTILPIFLFLEYYFKTDIPITISVFFIILTVFKFKDNLKRLSLLKPENAIKPVQSKNFKLTPREQEVADLLIKGTTYAKIGETLFISMPTVKTHVSNIYKKVGVKNKMELFYAISK